MNIGRVSAKVLALAALVACGGGGDGGVGPGGGGGGGGGGGAGACVNPGGSTVNICTGSFNPSSITINRNGTVTWDNISLITHNVIFPVDPQGGDIGDHASGSNTRTFLTAGTFSYSCTIHGFSGSVTVNP